MANWVSPLMPGPRPVRTGPAPRAGTSINKCGRAIRIGVGADGEPVEWIGFVMRQHREGRGRTIIDNRRTSVEAQIVANLGCVECGRQPERRVAIGQGQEIGGGGGRDRAGTLRGVGQGHDATGMAEGVEHLAKELLGVVRRIGKARRQRTQRAAHVPASRATVKNSTLVAAARAAIRRCRASASSASGDMISASSLSRHSSRWPSASRTATISA